MAGVFVSGSARARTFTAVLLLAGGAGNSVCAASSDDVDRMLGAVSAEAVKLRKCYESSLDLYPTLSCETRSETIKSAESRCRVEETDLRKAIIQSATLEQRASIASLTAAVLDDVRRRAEAMISDDAQPEMPFHCLVKPMSR
jgi:hypothetical protein